MRHWVFVGWTSSETARGDIIDAIRISMFVLEKIESRREQICQTLQFKGVSDMEMYRELMGNLDSLDFIEQELKSLLEKQELIDD